MNEEELTIRQRVCIEEAEALLQRYPQVAMFQQFLMKAEGYAKQLAELTDKGPHGSDD